MSIDGIMLAAIKKDLTEKILGGRIDKIYQINNNTLSFTIRCESQNRKMLISTDPAYNRLHISNLNYENPHKAPDFCMLLRKYLHRGIINKIEQPDFERILIFHIKLRKEKYYLITEVMGKYSNIIVINEEGIILDALKRINKQQNQQRQLYPGIDYQYPPRQDKIDPTVVRKEDFFSYIPDDFSDRAYKAIMYNYRGIGPYMAKEIIFRTGIDFKTDYSTLSKEDRERIKNSFLSIFQEVKQGKFRPAIGLDKHNNISYLSAYPLLHQRNIKDHTYPDTGKLFDYYYFNEVTNNKLNKSKDRLDNIIIKYLTKNRKKQKKYHNGLEDAARADRYKQYGELITANIYQIKKGLKEIELVNYFDVKQSKIKISLDPSLTPVQNAQKYYKKYNKVKKSVKHLKKQLGILRHEERYLEQVSLNIEQAESQSDLKEIREELIKEGYIKEKKKNKQKKKSGKPLPPYKFISSQGYQILAGRNNYQNDRLAKKIAHSEDIWLHVKKIAGSHVIIRNHTNDNIPQQTINEAAVIAAYYSKGRMSENVPVDYTKVKNIKKPKGAKPGLVYYEEYQTLYADPDKEFINKLKN